MLVGQTARRRRLRAAAEAALRRACRASDNAFKIELAKRDDRARAVELAGVRVSEPVDGQGIDRVDARLKVTGKADVRGRGAVANVAHAVIVGSIDQREARISRIDVARRRSASPACSRC